MTRAHYHVYFQTVGCQPDDNDVFTTKLEAARFLADGAYDLRASGRTVESDEVVVACTVVPFRFDERGTGNEMRCPPCAGMTQIRFDGRRLRTFLSARLTGLP